MAHYTGYYYFGNRCYTYVATAVTRPTAKSNCQAAGAWLATVNSADINTFIYNNLIGNSISAWMGMTEVGNYAWDHGEAVSYTNYEAYEPNGGFAGTHCTYFWAGHGGKWDDNACTASWPYICEFCASGRYSSVGACNLCAAGY